METAAIMVGLHRTGSYGLTNIVRSRHPRSENFPFNLFGRILIIKFNEFYFIKRNPGNQISSRSDEKAD